mgnify:CR=1 FL=1|tara:strand:- start:7081 stop:7995 length:915 start_codon:yes stop_codon:yes gene_type:complete
MFRGLIIGFIVLQAFLCVGQRSFFEPAEEPNKARLIGTSSAIGSLWAGSLIGLHQVWYSESWGDDFHSFDDSRQWMQMDKAGHFFTGQLLAQHSSSAFRWSGISRKKSRIIGSLISFGYLSSFEIMDGRADEWGFSWSDLSANALGCGWFLWQDILWEEQRLQLKFSAHLSPYAQYRPSVLGSTFAERLLKDYNGQTYWLSINPSSFLNESSRFPKWLNFAFGYSVDAKVHGEEDNYTLFYSDGGVYEFNAQRLLLFSLDVDLTRLPVKKPWLKTVCKVFNHVKIPFPTIQFSKSGFRSHLLYF